MMSIPHTNPCSCDLPHTHTTISTDHSISYPQAIATTTAHDAPPAPSCRLVCRTRPVSSIKELWETRIVVLTPPV